MSNEQEIAPLLPERFRFLETNQELLVAMESLRATNHRLSATGPVIRDYSIAVVRRLAQLGEDTDASLQRGRVITACMAARGVLETDGTFVDFIEKIAGLRERDDKERLRATVKRHFFASREFVEQLDGKSPHVADGIRCLEKSQFGTVRIYDILCEAVHPNWSGTAALPLLDDETNPIYLRLAFAAYSTGAAIRLCVRSVNEVVSGRLEPRQMKRW